MKIKQSALALAVTLATSTAAMAQDAIPVVPASVMKTANEQARKVAAGFGLKADSGSEKLDVWLARALGQLADGFLKA